MPSAQVGAIGCFSSKTNISWYNRLDGQNGKSTLNLVVKVFQQPE